MTEPADRTDGTFEALLMPLLDAAYRTAMHLARNREDAEDLVQDASLLAFRAYHTFQPNTNFKAWFFRILTNRFYSTYRQRRSEPPMHQLEDAGEMYVYLRSAGAGLLPARPDPARTTIGRLDAERVSAALDDLPTEYRVVATMYFMDDFSYQDIAEMLDIPLGTVRSRLHRGRKMLQKRLWQLAEDEGLVPSTPFREEVRA